MVSELDGQKKILPRLVFGQKAVRAAIILALVLIAIMGGLLFVFYKKLPPEVPLFYSRPWGEEQLASPWLLIVLPSLSLFIVILNFILSGLFFDSPFLVQALMWGATLFSFLATFTLVKIISIII